MVLGASVKCLGATAKCAAVSGANVQHFIRTALIFILIKRRIVDELAAAVACAAPKLD